MRRKMTSQSWVKEGTEFVSEIDQSADREFEYNRRKSNSVSAFKENRDEFLNDMAEYYVWQVIKEFDIEDDSNAMTLSEAWRWVIANNDIEQDIIDNAEYLNQLSTTKQVVEEVDRLTNKLADIFEQSWENAVTDMLGTRGESYLEDFDPSNVDEEEDDEDGEYEMIPVRKPPLRTRDDLMGESDEEDEPDDNFEKTHDVDDMRRYGFSRQKYEENQAIESTINALVDTYVKMVWSYGDFDTIDDSWEWIEGEADIDADIEKYLGKYLRDVYDSENAKDDIYDAFYTAMEQYEKGKNI